MNDNSGDRHILELENIDDGIESLFDELVPSETAVDVKVQGESVQEIVTRVQRVFAKAHMNYVEKMQGSAAIDVGLESDKENLQSGLEAYTRPALIRLLQLSRAQSGLTLEQFSTRVGVAVAEVTRIETDQTYLPTPRTIYKLAAFLKVPVKSLMALAGLIKLGDFRFDDAAIRFAANSESVERLSKEEHHLLREYVRFLCER